MAVTVEILDGADGVAGSATRYLGNCQLCERDQKLSGARMVHHGYIRPGHGSIEQDCPGVGHEPYETSCELIKEFKAGLERSLAGKRGYLAKLHSGEITHVLEFVEHRYGPPEVRDYRAGVTAPDLFARAIRSAISKTEHEIKQGEQTVARFADRISGWRPLPVRTIEEEERRTAEMRAERAKLAADRRVAKQAEETRKKAKRKALEARRQAAKDDFAARFRALADGSEEAAAKSRAVHVLYSELRKKKYDFIWGLRDLGCEEACIRLGIARRRGDGSVDYDFYR